MNRRLIRKLFLINKEITNNCHYCNTKIKNEEVGATINGNHAKFCNMDCYWAFMAYYDTKQELKKALTIDKYKENNNLIPENFSPYKGE